MSGKSVIGVPVLAAALVIGSVAGASAAAADTPSPPGSSGARLAQACSRIPARVAGVERLQRRLHADARTRGSIAFLEARVARARAEGRADLVTVLTDRLAVRKDLDGVLPDVLRRLDDARTVCAGTTSGTTTSGTTTSGTTTSGTASS